MAKCAPRRTRLARKELGREKCVCGAEKLEQGMDLRHEYLMTNGVQLHVVQAGPADGKLIIFLHGFPEFWYGWRNQIDFFANLGYRVWVPDQRGYNVSAKPRGLSAYNLDELAADVIGLLDAAQVDQALLVGHDWGAAVAWHTANKFPERLARLIILNMPHPRVMQKRLQSSWTQLRKSWYIFFFQLPWLPVALGRANHYEMVARSLVGSSRPGTFTDAALDLYREAWAQPRAYDAMLNWYRAVLQRQPQRLPSPRITVPTLMVWGAQDKFLGKELAPLSIALCDQGKLVFIETASHWIQHEEPAQVNRLIAGFIKS